MQLSIPFDMVQKKIRRHTVFNLYTTVHDQYILMCST